MSSWADVLLGGGEGLMKASKNDASARTGRRLTEEQMVQAIRQIRIGAVVAAVVMVSLLVFVVIWETNTKSFREMARYRPPPETFDDSGAEDYVPGVVVRGQTVYVPAYSHVYYGDGSPHLVTVTLSVRNTSIQHPLKVESVQYFDTNGNLVKSYLKKPLRLRPLATSEFLVEQNDTSGGSGANFLVKWTSEHRVTDPIIEAVMIGAEMQEGISFVRSGRVIEELPTPATSVPDSSGGQ